MPPEETSPVVVIGAGLAGLGASLALARAGMQVTLVEAGESVGGCCSHDTINGFTFNNGALYVAVPSLLRSAFGRLGMDFDSEVPLVAMTRPYQAHLEDGTVVRLSDAASSHVEGPRSRERTEILRDGLDRLQHHWAPIYRSLVDEVLPFEPSLLRVVSRLWRHLPRMKGQVDSLIASFFPDPALQDALASTLLYTGLAPDRLPATQIIGLLALLEEGFHLPRGGMGAITTALHRELQHHSVSIHCAQRVDRIDVTNDAVRGVTLSSGEHIAARGVIATGSGFDLVNRLLPEHAVPSRLRRQARKAPLSHRAIAIQVGCSVAHPPEAFIVSHVPSMRRQGLMHVSAPGVPHWLAYTTPTQVVSELAPQGKTVIEFYAPATGIASASQWTPEMTTATVENYLHALNARVPGLTIETLRTLDPQDFARSRHLYEGALYGIAPGATPDKFFPHRSALRGLYLAGQTTFPGYGVAPALLSGLQAAEAVLHDA